MYIHVQNIDIWSFPEIGLPLNYIIHLDGIIPYKPSNWGSPVCGNTISSRSLPGVESHFVDLKTHEMLKEPRNHGDITSNTGDGQKTSRICRCHSVNFRIISDHMIEMQKLPSGSLTKFY